MQVEKINTNIRQHPTGGFPAFTERVTMTEAKDRRTFDRLLNTEITAYLIPSNLLNFLRFRYGGKAAIQKLGKDQLRDLSASGSCIISRNKFVYGAPIILIIYAPGKKMIFIKGKVRWIFDGPMQNHYAVGIQFTAYGKGKKYNSYKNLGLLREYALGDI